MELLNCGKRATCRLCKVLGHAGETSVVLVSAWPRRLLALSPSNIAPQ